MHTDTQTDRQTIRDDYESYTVQQCKPIILQIGLRDLQVRSAVNLYLVPILYTRL